MEILIPSGFIFLFKPKRYKALYGGRGGAKSHNVGRALLTIAYQKKVRILCAREIQKSIKDSVHKLLSDIIASNPALSEFYTITNDKIVGANGSEFIFRGLKHNTVEIKSLEGVDYCWVEEAENVSDSSWELLIPTIRKENSEIWVTFNVKNISDPTYQRFVANPSEDTVSVKVSWRDNPFFPDTLRKEMEKLKNIDFEAYLHVWEGEPDTRRSGAVYAKQIAKAREEGRVTLVPYDPSREVFTAWDLGWGDSTCIWWLQWVGRELRWIDYYENSGEQLDHYAALVKGKPYNYMKDGHFLPHDGAAGNIRGDSVASQLKALGVHNTVLGRDPDITPSIELMRQTIAFSVFDSEKCKEGIRALEHYGYEWDNDMGRFKSKPRHDWASHAADAARAAATAAERTKSGLNRKPVSFSTGSRSWMAS